MEIRMDSISMCDVLHFLGWKGTPVEPEIMKQIRREIDLALSSLRPCAVLKGFSLEEGGVIQGTSLRLMGNDMQNMLSSCSEVWLLAATLGAESERLLLRRQASGAAQAMIMDAVLSAAVESVCDQAEADLRKQIAASGRYLTDRFSPGYGDLPLAQSREICEILSASRSIGLTVSNSGIMIPRKSVTAVLGVSDTPVRRRTVGCEVCRAKDRCAYRRIETSI